MATLHKYGLIIVTCMVVVMTSLSPLTIFSGTFFDPLFTVTLNTLSMFPRHYNSYLKFVVLPY